MVCVLCGRAVENCEVPPSDFDLGVIPLNMLLIYFVFGAYTVIVNIQGDTGVRILALFLAVLINYTDPNF